MTTHTPGAVVAYLVTDIETGMKLADMHKRIEGASWMRQEPLVLASDLTAAEARVVELEAAVRDCREAIMVLAHTANEQSRKTQAAEAVADRRLADVSKLREACAGLLIFIQEKYPFDFLPGGRRYICPHHKAIACALDDLTRAERAANAIKAELTGTPVADGPVPLEVIAAMRVEQSEHPHLPMDGSGFAKGGRE